MLCMSVWWLSCISGRRILRKQWPAYAKLLPQHSSFRFLQPTQPRCLEQTPPRSCLVSQRFSNDLDRQSSTGPRTRRRPTLWARPVATCGCRWRSCRSVVAQCDTCEVLRIAARVAVQIKDRALAAEATVGWPHFGDATGNFVFF